MGIKLEFPGYLDEQDRETILIKNPDQFDVDSVPVDSVVRQSRNGTIYSTKRTDESQKVILSTLPFSFVKEDDVEVIQDFLIDAQGHYIRYTDYNDKVWMSKLLDTNVTFDNSTNKFEFTMVIMKWEI